MQQGAKCMGCRIENRFYRYILVLFLVSLNLAFLYANEHKRAEEYSFKFKHLTVREGLSHNRVNCILQDSKGFMWFGTQEGLNRYDGYQAAIYLHQPGDLYSLNDNRVRSLIEDRQGVLWIGTRKGLNKFERDKNQWRVYTVKDGLPDNMIYGILEDGQANLWLSTNNGLAKFNPRQGTIITYSVQDGIQGEEYNTGAYYKNTLTGEMFFGGMNGFNSFYPDQVKDNTYIPPVVITSIKTADFPKGSVRPVYGIKDIRLSYRDNSFSITFTALNYRNPEENRYAYILEGVDPEVMAFDVCELVQPKIGAKSLEIICRISNKVPSNVNGDPGRFRQVLVNLMGNAVKFTESGEIELSIDAAKKDAAAITLHAAVRDTGIGIPKDKLKAIFNAFHQADGSTTRKYGGSGLGLAICKQLSKLMGGDIWVESEEGKGSTFHFTALFKRSGKKSPKRVIPESLAGKKVLIVDDNLHNLEILTHLLTSAGMKVEALSRGKNVMPALLNAAGNREPFDLCILDDAKQSTRILLAEDNPINRKLANYLLTKAGYQVEMVNNGKEAVDLYKTGPGNFDIIFMDVQMPGMDGKEAARLLRSHGYHDIPIVALTAQAMKGDREKCLAAGMNDYISKPIKREVVFEMVKKWTLKKE
jgi:CheY-like chemotaxis protein